MVEYIQKNDLLKFYINQHTGCLDNEAISTVSDNDFVYISTLKYLVDNGIGNIKDSYYYIDVDSFYSIHEFDRNGLGINLQKDIILYIEHVGLLNKIDFRFCYSFRKGSQYGEIIDLDLNGPLRSVGPKQYILEASIYNALKRINTFNSLEKKLPEDCFRVLAEIKALSKSGLISFDKYLEQEDVYITPAVRIDLSADSNSLKIKPDVDIEFDNNFSEVFEKYTTVRPVYPVTSHNKRRGRVVLSQTQTSELAHVKEKSTVSDKETINDIISNPERYFDPEVIDISVFYSDRVLEIGLYTPKYSTFISPYRSSWVPGIEIDMLSEGNKMITVDSDNELTELGELIFEADEKELDSIWFKRTKISLDAAKELYELAKTQIGNTEPVTNLNGKPVRRNKVLIIKENAEQLEYSQNAESNLSIENSFSHKFHPVETLAQHIVLKDHQIEGIAWMQSLQMSEFGGCLLADDMGLGKTLQVLYFIEWYVDRVSNTKPVMIIAPISLLENWEQEYNKFFARKSLDIFSFHGSNGYDKRNIDKRLMERLNKSQLILTNYETLRSYQLSMCAVDYGLIVLDEAQRIKTPGTIVTSAAKALAGDFKIAMTGTPVENSLIDLWCIMDFVFPGLLNTLNEFKKEYSSKDMDPTELSEMGERLRSRIGVLLKRRLKTDVAKDLPKKYLSNHNVDIEHFKEFDLTRTMPKVQLDKYIDEIRKYKTGVNDQILNFIQRIKAITDHPYLGDENLLAYSSDDLLSCSAKLQILLPVLDSIKRKEEKVIIFAERRETQLMLQKIIHEFYHIYPSIINGETPAQQSKATSCRKSRQGTIEEFTRIKGFNILILSPVAAGVGLNITAANHVIHYSRHWNPAKEEQATDRAFRIGQTKPVYVYYPMAVCPDFDSFDVILDKLLNKKLSLATSTLYPSEQVEVIPSDIFNRLMNN